MGTRREKAGGAGLRRSRAEPAWATRNAFATRNGVSRVAVMRRAGAAHGRGCAREQFGSEEGKGKRRRTAPLPR